MKHTHRILCAAVIALLALCLSGCGKEAPAPAPTVPTSSDLPLGLASSSLSTTTWSSPNGATVHLSATPTRYAQGDSARFVVRLEGEEAANVPCELSPPAATCPWAWPAPPSAPPLGAAPTAPPFTCLPPPPDMPKVIPPGLSSVWRVRKLPMSPANSTAPSTWPMPT